MLGLCVCIASMHTRNGVLLFLASRRWKVTVLPGIMPAPATAAGGTCTQQVILADDTSVFSDTVYLGSYTVQLALS